jgi:hypothetical protein
MESNVPDKVLRNIKKSVFRMAVVRRSVSFLSFTTAFSKNFRLQCFFLHSLNQYSIPIYFRDKQISGIGIGNSGNFVQYFRLPYNFCNTAPI